MAFECLPLTRLQELVDVVDGKGVLLDWGSSFEGRRRLDDDVAGARWAATELFRPDDTDIRPTKMSDVYSFACLMLQVRLSACLSQDVV